MMDIFGETKRISSLLFLFKLMEKKGAKIDVDTYTSMLNWLSNDGNVDGSVKLWEEMKEKGGFPIVLTYTAYIKGFGVVAIGGDSWLHMIQISLILEAAVAQKNQNPEAGQTFMARDGSVFSFGVDIAMDLEEKHQVFNAAGEELSAVKQSCCCWINAVEGKINAAESS
nr:pentatricopeptide repeat-containing protein At2g01390 [Tanacetum cinerariifolium]